MGQYYRPVLTNTSHDITVFNRNVDGRYTLAKLMEHSWWGNEMVDTICKKLYKNPHKVAWVGDYADSADPVNGLTKEEVEWLHGITWNTDGVDMKKDALDLDGKYLVNHTKKMYINCSRYAEENTVMFDSLSWIVHPLPLLTCIGNGLGGGDYKYKDEWGFEWEPGGWANDLISIEDTPPDGYEETMAIFKEPPA